MSDKCIRCLYTPFPFGLLSNKNLVVLLEGTIVFTQSLKFKL
jgi:hypothetical protein